MNDTIQLLFYALPILLVAITLHEVAHAYIGDALGDDTARQEGRITLNPLAHIDPFLTIGLPLLLILIGAPPFGAAKPVPMNPFRIKYGDFGVALVALGGPLVNLLLAIVSAFGYRLLVSDPTSWLATLLILSVQINIGFFVFNMIPFPPLDGSRLLYALSPEPLQRIMLQIEQLGFIAIIGFMFVIFPVIRPIFIGVSDFLLQALF